MSAQPTEAKALLLPADGSDIRLVSYAIKERGKEDMVDSGLAEFYDPIPNLKPWLNGAYQQRAMTAFYVDTQKRDHYDPIARSFIKLDDSAGRGQYCLYYTLSPSLPHNETCKRILDIQPPSDRLFWRGDVLVVRYEGHLGLGHVYKDAKEALLAPVEVLIQKAYESQGLERVHEEYKSFNLQDV